MEQYFLKNDNEKTGPFTFEQLLKKGITPDTMVWVAETHTWVNATQLPEVQTMLKDRAINPAEGPVANRLVQAALAEKLKSEQYISVNGEWPTMTLGNAIKECFAKYFVFSGRSRRSEFWWFSLFFFLLTLITLGLGSIFAIVPLVAVSVRRLHDVDRSGWWYYIFLVPVAIVLALLILFNYDYYTDTYTLFGAHIESLTQLAYVTIISVLCVVIACYSIALVIFFCTDSELRENKYGLSPKYQSPGYVPETYNNEDSFSDTKMTPAVKSKPTTDKSK